MFTICPSCTRQFRIYAKHIAAASGQMRCGFCNQQFNALEYLYDRPLTNEGVLNQIGRTVEKRTEYDFKNTKKKQSVDVLTSKYIGQTDKNLKTIASKPKIKQTTLHEKNLAPNYFEKINSKESAIEKDTVKAFLEKPILKRDRSLTIFFYIASFIALTTIALQLIWFNRDEVLLKYPELRPYLKQICQKLDCRLIRKRDPDAIKLISRDVRLHPSYKDALLINAIIRNELDVRQPYPNVQLAIYDIAGILLAYRNFMPTDYLDDSIDIDDGMPVNLPVHLVLEVAGPTASAVSFEFNFF